MAKKLYTATVEVDLAYDENEIHRAEEDNEGELPTSFFMDRFNVVTATHTGMVVGWKLVSVEEVQVAGQ